MNKTLKNILDAVSVFAAPALAAVAASALIRIVLWATMTPVTGDVLQGPVAMATIMTFVINGIRIFVRFIDFADD